MPLVSSKDLFKKAYGNYAIGAFNVNNMEIMQAIMDAAAEEQAPVIVQISSGARKYAKQEYLVHLIKAALEIHPEVPAVMHLDHGESVETAKMCIDNGYTSVMIDGSHEEYETNVVWTKEVVDYAHKKNVQVEAELGQLVGEQYDEGEGGKFSDGIYTDPNQAAEFVERTGCDSLAVAIGTSHGAYKFKGEPRLDMDRLRAIQSKLPKKYPLVLHGASSAGSAPDIQKYIDLCNEYGGEIKGSKGTPEGLFAEAIKYGVCKINIDTDLRLVMTGAIRREIYSNPSNFDPRKYLGPAREELQEQIQRKMRVLGCGGKI